MVPMGSAAMDGGDAVLVINCGSSSVKYQLIAVGSEAVVAGGVFERIGESGSRLRHREADKSERVVELPAANHREALAHIAETLRRGLSPLRLAAVGHRVVHGGEHFQEPARIDEDVLERIRSLSPLAPLHNPVNVIGIEVALNLFPNVSQVAVFDTAFHQRMPRYAAQYAIPQDWYRNYGVRRYGFHGTSHEYVAERAARYLARPLSELKLITLHLGNGASAAAIAAGVSIDTSMGLTPLEGLVMGSRSGDLDPAIIAYMQRVAGLDAAQSEQLLNHAAGLKGLGGSNDMRQILAAATAGNEAAELALEVFCYRIKKYIGAYLAVLGGIDALVFTGGIGENAAPVRSRSTAGLRGLGIAVDSCRNESAEGAVAEIQESHCETKVLVIRTNEELQIARQVLSVCRRATVAGCTTQ